MRARGLMPVVVSRAWPVAPVCVALFALVACSHPHRDPCKDAAITLQIHLDGLTKHELVAKTNAAIFVTPAPPAKPGNVTIETTNTLLYPGTQNGRDGFGWVFTAAVEGHDVIVEKTADGIVVAQQPVRVLKCSS
jgi:hypothetical protein